MKSTKEKIAVMQAYEDGREIEERWLLGNTWHTEPSPDWNWEYYDYDIKQSTILVNGIEVPEPVRVMPEYGATYYFPRIEGCFGVGVETVTSLDDESFDVRVLSRGLMHLTESAARQHYEALIAPSRRKS